MKLNYAVTFEFIENPPVTIRGTVEASNPAPGAARAIKDAKKRAEHGGRGWSSISLLIEKQGGEDGQS